MAQPGSYEIEAGVDSESPVTEQGASAIVEVADAPVSTSFALALPQ